VGMIVGNSSWRSVASHVRGHVIMWLGTFRGWRAARGRLYAALRL
jgi:hypothetical protein